MVEPTPSNDQLAQQIVQRTQKMASIQQNLAAAQQTIQSLQAGGSTAGGHGKQGWAGFDRENAYDSRRVCEGQFLDILVGIIP